MNWLAKLRFLPLTIFFAALMLTVKISNIWNSADGLISPVIDVSEARAQEREKKPTATKTSETQDTSEAQAQQIDKKLNLNGGDQTKFRSEASNNVKSDGEGDRQLDPTFLTPEEIEILQQLGLRRDQLDAREQEMDLRNGLLSAAEGRIDQKIAELQKLRSIIDSLIKKYDKQQDAKLKSLVKIYENMKPKDAARIFEDLEMDTLLEVSERMKERKLAGIIAKISPQKAREITVELRKLRNLPQVGG